MTRSKVMLTLFAVSITLLFAQPTCAQQEKGDVEVVFFSGGFFVGLNDDSSSSGNIGARVGYFLTRRHEIGGAVDILVHRFSVEDDRETDLRLFLAGFYRYNFASENAKGFPFIGADISASDVTEDFGRIVSLRPHVGFK